MRRGFVIWSVGLGLLLAGVAVAQGWTMYSPEGGRYRIDMPGTPAVNAVPISRGAQSVNMNEASVQLPGAAYLVSYADYPDRVYLAGSSDVMLDRVRDGMSAGHTLRGEKKVTLGRQTGREFVVTQADGTNTVARIFWVRNRLYQVTVAGGAGIDSQPDTRRFLESFALVRPQPG